MQVLRRFAGVSNANRILNEPYLLTKLFLGCSRRGIPASNLNYKIIAWCEVFEILFEDTLKLYPERFYPQPRRLFL